MAYIYFFSEYNQSINKELSKLICGRKSILLKKGADILQECNLFSACVIEMQECCPLLLEVLSTSQGTLDAPEKKIATLATIYGMLIHSRDPLASGIQRMYSTLAIRYHADNKVIFNNYRIYILEHFAKILC